MSNDFDVHERLGTVFENRWHDVLLNDIVNDKIWTYGEVLCHALGVDSWLERLGVEDSENIAVAPENGPLPLVIYLGAALSGRTVFAIDPSRGEQDIDEMFDATPVDRFLTDAKSLEDRTEAVRYSHFEGMSVTRNEAIRRIDDIDPASPWLVTFTSGTTGTPKAVVHSVENLVHSAVRFGDRFEFDAADTFYHALPMAYMAGILNGLLVPMTHGSTVAIGRRVSATTAPTFIDDAAGADTNVFWFTPTILQMLLRLCSGPYAGANEAVGCVATEPLPADLLEAFQSEFGISLYETYGLSETLFITTEYPGYQSKGDGVGPTLDDVNLQVRPDGEIVVQTPWLFLEYYNREENSVENGCYPTGDIGRVQGDTVVITGRKKDLIVRNGINISPDRVRDVICESEQVKDAVVVGRSTEDVGERVVALVVPTKENVNTDRIQQAVIENIGSDHRVDRFMLRAELPRNADGEPDRDAVHAILDELR